MRRISTDAIAFVLIGIAAVAYFFHLFYPESQLIVTPDFGRSDIWHFHFPVKYMLSEALANGTLPFWIPEMGGGFPLLGEGQVGAFFLPNTIVYILFDAVTAYNMTHVLSLAVLGWGMYLWLRLWNFDRIAVLAMAGTAMFSGMVISQISHISLLQAYGMLPILFWAIHRLMQERTVRWFAIFVFLQSQQLLTGFPQGTFTFVLFGYLYIMLVEFKGFSRIARTIWYGIAGILTLALSSAQLIPSFEFMQHSTVRGGFSPDMASYFSYPFSHLTTLIDPFLLGNPRLGTYPPFFAFDGSIFWENTAFVGVLPLILAAAALFIPNIRKAQPKLTRLSIIIIVLSLLLMLGSHSPLYIVYSVWPFTLFRVPARYLWTFILFILVLSSFTIDYVMTHIRQRRILTWVFVLLLTIHLAHLVSTFSSYHMVGKRDAWMDPPDTIELLDDTQRIFTVGAQQQHNKWFLHEGWQDPTAFAFMKESYAPNSNVFWDIPQQMTYAGRFLGRPSLIDTLIDTEIDLSVHNATVSAIGKRMLDLHGVDRIISFVPLTMEGVTDLDTRDYRDAIVRFYETDNQTPRAYIATDIREATTVRDALVSFWDESFIPGQSVVVEEPLDLEATENPPTATVTDVSDTEVDVALEGETGTALLILTDSNYPGWHAYTQDEEEVPVINVNIRQRGVIIPAGTTHIRMEFVQNNFKEAAMVSGILYGLTVFLAVYPRPFGLPGTARVAHQPSSRRRRSRGT